MKYLVCSLILIGFLIVGHVQALEPQVSPVVVSNAIQPFGPYYEDSTTATDTAQPTDVSKPQVTQHWLFIQDATNVLQGGDLFE